MNNPPYWPRKKSDLRAYVLNALSLITADEAAFGLLPADSAEMAAVISPWVAAYDLTQSPDTATPAAVADANSKQSSMTPVVQGFIVGISRNENVSDENKTAVGATIPSVVRTPVPTPTASPVLSVASMKLNEVQIRVANSETPNSDAAPLGCSGSQCFIRWGPDFTNDPSQASYVNQFTRPLYRLDTTGRSGMKASVFHRFATRNGGGGKAKFGPWSAPLHFVAP